MPSQLGLIWPKEPRRGNNPAHRPRGSRLMDVLTNRGPDIQVGRIDTVKQKQKQKQKKTQTQVETNGPSPGQRREEEGVKNGNGNEACAVCDAACGVSECQKGNGDVPSPSPCRGMNQVPDVGVQSNAQHCERERCVVPVQLCDRYGVVYPAPWQHHMVYGDNVRL